MASAAVSLEAIEKRFGSTVALVSLTLTAEAGEFLILLGPSGCGKTTALRIVAGLEAPTAGTVRIGDQVVNDVEPKDRDVAMVFQSYALYPHLSVRRNIEFPLRARRVARDEREQRVKEAARSLQLEELLERKPGQLSGGQRQRVALARAIVRDPKAFLMDEPLSNLDARLRVEMRAELIDLHRTTGTTVIYVTHDQVEAMQRSRERKLDVIADGRWHCWGRQPDHHERPSRIPQAARDVVLVAERLDQCHPCADRSFRVDREGLRSDADRQPGLSQQLSGEKVHRRAADEASVGPPSARSTGACRRSPRC